MVGAEPADAVTPLHAERREAAREAANAIRELAVGAVALTMDQRGLIRRDSCSPLYPRPDSAVQKHWDDLFSRRTEIRAMGKCGQRICPGQRGRGAREGIARPLRPGS